MHHENRPLAKMSTTIILSLTTCFMFFIYAPMELYLTNQSEFFYDVYILFPLIFCNFLLFFIVSVLVGKLLLHTRLSRPYLYAYFIAFVCSYIQGNFFAAWLPIIKGQMLNWNDYPIERLKSILLWVIVIALFFVLLRKKGYDFMDRLIKIVSGGMGLMLLITLCILFVSTGGYQKKEILSTATAKDMLTLSQNKNFVILLLDAADSPSMEQVIAEDPDRYEPIFEDFTYYTNTTSGYPYTAHSIPLILTGEWFEKQTTFEAFRTEAYRNSPLFANLEELGYRMGIYEVNFAVDASEQNRFDNILSCKRKVSSPFTFCRWQVQMTGYRYAPFDLKRFCYVYTNAFNTLKVLPENELFEDENDFFWDRLRGESFNLIDQNCFRFIHVEGAHTPYLHDEDMNRVENATYNDALKSCLTITDTYLKKLKETGIYDDSCIIIMADHGYGSGFNDNPIFFVKGFAEHHPLQRNDAPISHGDLQEAYRRLLAGQDSSTLFDWSEGDDRERRFLFQDDDNNPQEIMEEYLQKGHAGNRDTLIKIREF